MVNLLYSFVEAHLMASSRNAKTRFLSKIGKRLAENFLLKVGRRRGRV